MTARSLGQLFEERDNNFNLIRVLAALAVIYGHAGAVTGHGPPDFFLRAVGYKFIGGAAVDVFFVLSGFLITASAMSRRGLAYYAASRLLRIYPALAACVLLSVFLLGPALTQLSLGDYFQAKQTWRYLWQNMTAWRTQYELPGVFTSLHDHAVNGSLWSLAVEIRLYVMVVVFALAGLLARRAAFNALFAAVAGITLAQPDAWAHVIQYDNHRAVSLMFLIGAFMWVNRQDIPMSWPLAAILVAFAAALKQTPYFGLAYTVVLPYLVFMAAFLPGLSWFNRSGDYSYGVYLYGWICQQLVLSWWPGVGNVTNTVLASLAALALAMLSWHGIEKPALALKVRFARRREAAATAAGPG